MSILTVFSVAAEGTQPGSQLDAKIRQFEHQKENLTKKLEEISKSNVPEEKLEKIKKNIADIDKTLERMSNQVAKELKENEKKKSKNIALFQLQPHLKPIF